MEQLRPPTDILQNTPPPISTISMPTQMGINENNPVSNSTTREYNIEDIKPESKSFTVDLMGEDADVKFASIKTPDARPDANNQNTSYINQVPGVSNSMGGGPAMGGNLIKSRDELRSGVKAAIMVVDYVISLIAMKIAGDTQQRGHTADTSQKKLLEDVIVEYLFGKQKAMPLWLTLVFAIAGSYGLILFAAIRQRSQITKNKKLAQAKDEPIKRSQEAGVRNQEVGSRGEQYIKVETPAKYQEATPTYTQGTGNVQPGIRPLQGGGIPRDKLTLNKQYSDKNKDGVMEPVSQASFTDTINPPRKSTFDNPDKDLVADSATHLRELVNQGRYPMFKKNLSGKVIKIRYNENGQPIMAGKPAKVFGRKSRR